MSLSTAAGSSFTLFLD